MSDPEIVGNGSADEDGRGSGPQPFDGRLTDDVAFVVLGGYGYSPKMNNCSTVTVRELGRRFRVLNFTSEAHGSILRRLQGRAPDLDMAGVARTVFGSTRPRRVEERVWIASVRGLESIGPLSYPEIVRRRNVRVFTEVIRDWMREIGVERCVLLFYWWMLPELVSTVPNLTSIYDCTDEHTALPGGLIPATVIARLEDRLLDAVDRAYVVSPALLEDRARPGRDVSILPNGFDLRLFGDLKRDGFVIPEQLRKIPEPVIGYSGGLTSRMPWELLQELATRHPEWNFAFLGGDPQVAPAGMHERPNVYFEASMPYTNALGAITRFDVGTIPVRVGRFSRGNSFLKLLDYFAHGMPVVATPVPDTERIAQERPGLLYLAGDAEEWGSALKAALEEPSDSPLRDARRAYVEERSTERRVMRMLDETFGEAGPDRS